MGHANWFRSNKIIICQGFFRELVKHGHALQRHMKGQDISGIKGTQITTEVYTQNEYISHNNTSFLNNLGDKKHGVGHRKCSQSKTEM